MGGGNIMRLIDADALIDDIRKNSESYFADDFAHIWVDKQTPVEAQPVRHGKWRHYERILTCSECGTMFYDDIMEYCGDAVPRHCPECGANMDADKKKSYFPKGFFSKERPLANGKEDETD
jgi:hypothetical protein